MLALSIILAVLVLLTGLTFILQIRIDICVIVSLEPDRRALNIEVLPMGRERWKQQYQVETPPGQLLPILLRKLSEKRQQFHTPGWMQQLSISQSITLFSRLFPVIRHAMRYISIKNINWRSTYGGEDAMQTAVRTGEIWAGKGIIISLLSSWCRLEGMQLGVEPDFKHERLWSRFSGIFQVKLVHIIIIGAYILVWIVRGYWIGRTARKSIKSSHRGINENCYAEY